MQDETIIIAMLVLLAPIAGLVIWSVARVVQAILRDRRLRRQPRRQFRHPALGLFTSEGSLWTCEVVQSDRALRLAIGGTPETPSELLLAQAQELLRRFPELERQALGFLRQNEAEARGAMLDFHLLRLDDEQHPNDFTFEFLAPHDNSRIWRVEFVNQRPRHTGFDN